MKRKVILFFLFFSYSQLTLTQNLVKNPSFENIANCPTYISNIDVAQFWSNPLDSFISSPNIFNSCALISVGASVPNNFAGNIAAHTGNGYLGVSTYKNTSTFREYIQGELSTPLVAGQEYYVSFWTALGSKMKYGATNLGGYFSDTIIGPYKVQASSLLSYSPQLINTASPLTNTTYWVKLEWIYTAIGGESFILIGNFDDNFSTNSFINNPNAVTGKNYAYYYIDDVTVEPKCDISISLDSIRHNCDNTASIGSVSVTVSNGIPGYTYHWSNGKTIEDISGLIAGTYVLTVTDTATCSKIDTFIIEEPLSSLSVTLDSFNSESCIGFSDGFINSYINGGVSLYSFLWSNGETTPNISGLVIGAYDVTVTDANNCKAFGSSTIRSADSIHLEMELIKDIIDCDGNSVGILGVEVNGGVGVFTYIWTNGVTDKTVSALAAGNYVVTAMDANGCKEIDSALVRSPFIPSIYPYVNVMGQNNIVVYEGDTVLISSGNNQTLNGVNYLWTSMEENGNNFDFLNPNNYQSYALSNTNGVYELTLTVISNDGCIDSGILWITVQGELEGMPTAFSPNFDGINDIFRPLGVNDVDILDFKVFNRWGQVLYSSPSLFNGGWDGTFQGVEQPRDEYIYLMKYKLHGKKEKLFKGTFMLLR